MVDNIFSQIIPLTAAMALPVPLLKAIRLLFAGRPVIHSILFIATWGTTCFLVLSLSVIFREWVTVVFGKIALNSLPEYFSGWIHIIMGLLFIGIGIKKLNLALEHKKVSVSQLSVDITASSIIISTMRLELFKLKNGLLLILIVYVFLKSQMSIPRSLIASGLIAATSMIWVSMPLMIYFWTGRKRDLVLEALKEWLLTNNTVLIVFIFFFIGISTLSTGIGEMIPKLLVIVFEAIEG